MELLLLSKCCEASSEFGNAKTLNKILEVKYTTLCVDYADSTLNAMVQCVQHRDLVFERHTQSTGFTKDSSCMKSTSTEDHGPCAAQIL